MDVGVGNTGEDFDAGGSGPEPRHAVGRQSPHAQHDCFRPELTMNLVQTGGGTVGDKLDDLHSSVRGLFRTRNDGCVLHLNARRNFRVGKHSQVGEGGLEEAAKGQP